MDRNGITVESINCQEIKTLRPIPLEFAFHRDARISQDHIYFARTVLEIGEIAVGTEREPNDIRIDLIITEIVSRPGVGRDRSDAQADHADSEISLPSSHHSQTSGMLKQGQADTAIQAIVRSRQIAFILGLKL